MVSNQSKSALGNWVAVAMVVWLLFFNGFSSIRALLESGALRNAGSAIQTGAGRVASPAAPATGAKPPITAPRTSSGASVAQQPASQAAAEAQADAAYQATVQAVNAAQPPAAAAQQPAVVAPLSTVPTAVILIPTAVPVAQVVVVPQAMPQTYAQTGPIAPTAVPTMAYPTPLPPEIANAYTLSDDGTCITVSRGGAQYQNCQADPFTPGAARSVADLMRTGVIPGTKVE